MPGRKEEQIKNIVKGTRGVLLRATEGVSNDPSDEQSLDLRVRFQGCCGLAQCVAGYALQDEGLSVRPLATQSLKGYWYGHAALTVEVEEDGVERLFIVDPTFCQFIASAEAAVPLPATYLRQTPEGALLLAEILRDGYAELTEERALLYLDAFCNGNSGLGIKEAFDFVKNPPEHPYHFRRDIDSDEFSRESLKNLGWRIP